MLKIIILIIAPIVLFFILSRIRSSASSDDRALRQLIFSLFQNEARLTRNDVTKTLKQSFVGSANITRVFESLVHEGLLVRAEGRDDAGKTFFQLSANGKNAARYALTEPLG